MGRTGAFVSTHAEMERMKAETVVDLFQFIKGMRTQRAGMVSNKVLIISFAFHMGAVEIIMYTTY